VTRELIFQAGARLLEEGGAEALTVGAVAARAGVSVGSVYRRFGDKDRLLASLQADFTTRFRAEIVRRFASAPGPGDADPGELVTAAVAGVAETFQAHQCLLRVFILLGTANEAVLREGAEASVDGGRAFRRFLEPVVSHVRHSDAEEALDFSFRLVYAMCAHRVVHGAHLESARPLSWPRLTEELAMTVKRYLLG
jgi:AcrR family transcriptional regulator